MADFTQSTGLRDIIAANLAACYYWVTLHGAGQVFAAGDTYTLGCKGELTTANGYTQGGLSLALANTNGVLDGPDAVWTAVGGSIGPVSFIAVWMNSTNSLIGAKLLCVKDVSGTPQTSSSGQPMTGGIVNPITIPTPN